MLQNISALLKACDALNINYETQHDTRNLISITLNGQTVIFCNWSTPFNSHSVSQLCLDKDYFYHVYRSVINFPKTHSFMSPYCSENYFPYLKAETVTDIIQMVEKDFHYPLIVKKNRGSLGRQVFVADNKKQLEGAILSIFNKQSASSDYVCLIQEKIDIAKEYRVVYFRGELCFAYEKNIEDATFDDNLSPLHWEGATAVLTRDEEILSQIDAFCQPMFKKMMIPFCGLDVAQDKQGTWWLIEANSSPGFSHIISAGEEEAVVNLYKKMLLSLQ